MRPSAEQVLAQLKEGNGRFVAGESRSSFSVQECAAVAGEPNPVAVVVGCSDSRVPVEAIFDVGVGDLWVLRSAGNVISDAGLASVRFGVQQWDIPLVVVIGHDDCLAVQAAMEPDSPEWLRPITDYISPGLHEHAEGDEEERLATAVDEHVRATVDALRLYLGRIPLEQSTPPVVGGTYRLATGEVRWAE